MKVDAASISLSPKEVIALVNSVPLPKGVSIGDVSLTDSGMEAVVKASVLLGLPVKFKFEIEGFSGSRVLVKVSPPVKPNWLLVRPAVLAIPGAKYAGNSVVEVDLAALSRGYVPSITLKRIYLGKSGFSAEVTSISASFTWSQLLSGMGF